MARVTNAYFAPVPNRALWDDRLTDRDVRILGVIAAHDQLSGAKGKGQGAWASHARMAALAGTEYSRFSVSVNRLLNLGYLQRDRLRTDRRKFTYRVIYSPEDRLPSSKQLLCPTANEPTEIVCSGPELSDYDGTESSSQYISQSEERYSAKAGEDILENQPRFAPNGSPECRGSANVGAQLAALERALKHEDEFDLIACYRWLEECLEHDDPKIRGWAFRLSEDLLVAMSAEEQTECLETC